MDDKVKSFLDKIQEFNEKKSKVFVSSLNEEIDSLSLTFKQQKDLISTIGDGAVGSLKFQKILNDIIVDNTGKSDILVTDKLPIILKLRIDAIGSIIKKDDVDIDIVKLLNRVKKLKFETKKIISGDVNVELKIPTISSESKIIQVAIDSIKREESEFGKNVGNIYTYEIVKYVDKVIIGDDILEMSIIPIKDRYKIVENLPLNINKDIIEFIQSIKSKESDTLRYNGDKVLDIDVSFFDS